MVNPCYIDSEIDKYGSSVAIIGKHCIRYDDHGDQYFSGHEINTVAVLNDITGLEEFNEQGIFVPGDKIFFFKSTEDPTELVAEHFVKFNNTKYKIVQVVSHNLQNKQFPFEVRCKKT